MRAGRFLGFLGGIAALFMAASPALSQKVGQDVAAASLSYGDLNSVATFVSSTNPLPVTGIAAGNVAAGATDSGNPVKVGGVYNSTSPTLTTGQRGDVQLDSRGHLVTEICSQGTAATSATCSAVAQPGDGNSPTAPGLRVLSYGFVFEPTSNLESRAFVCTNFAAVNVTAGNTTQIVALAASKVVRVCSANLGISATGTFGFVSGTGSNCATPANATQAMELVTGTPFVSNAAPGGSIYAGSLSGELCVVAATGNVHGWVMYATTSW